MRVRLDLAARVAPASRAAAWLPESEAPDPLRGVAIHGTEVVQVERHGSPGGRGWPVHRPPARLLMLWRSRREEQSLDSAPVVDATDDQRYRLHLDDLLLRRGDGVGEDVLGRQRD